VHQVGFHYTDLSRCTFNKTQKKKIFQSVKHTWREVFSFRDKLHSQMASGTKRSNHGHLLVTVCFRSSLHLFLGRCLHPTRQTLDTCL